MRIVTIKARVTLWYAATLLTLTLLTLLALFAGVEQAAMNYHEQLLTRAMASASEAVRSVNGVPVLESEAAEDFDQVTFALLTDAGDLWQGRWPSFSLPFSDGAVREVQSAQGERLLTQDLRLPLPEGDVWLRGYLTLNVIGFLEEAAAYRLALLLPLAAGLGVLGGYLITRRAFRPVGRMSAQAERILDGRDLSQRFPEGRDELGRLGRSCNGMLARLSASFERERQFADDASHELRTPLTVILSACELARGEDLAACREALGVIQRKAQGMQEMVQQLLQMARMEGGRVPLRLESLDFSALCTNAAQECVRRCQLDLTGVAAHVTLQGDELLLLRLVTLLADNADKFAASRVWLRLTQTAQETVLQVGDDGPGIPPKLREKVFDRFFQLDAARSAQRPGAGLGLTMAREIARLHGGSLAVAAQAGPGAVLELRLPRR